MHRRTFLGGTAAAALTTTTAATATACTGKDTATGKNPDPAPTGTPHTTAPGTPTRTPATATTSAPATWSALAKSLDGQLLRPGDDSWQTAHRLYNTRFDTLKPTAVAYAAHADDIRTALSYARAHRIPVAIRNGGHSYAG